MYTDAMKRLVAMPAYTMGPRSVRSRDFGRQGQTARTEERGGDHGVGQLLGVRQDVSHENPHRGAACAFRARQGVHNDRSGQYRVSEPVELGGGERVIHSNWPVRYKSLLGLQRTVSDMVE